MKAIRSPRLLLVGVLLVATVGSLAGDDRLRVSGTTNAPGLRVRQEPTLEAESLGNLDEGARVELLDVTDERMTIGSHNARWYSIAPLPGGDEPTGWSYGAFIDVSPEAQLVLAIWNGRQMLIRELLERGIDPNVTLLEEGIVFTQYDEYEFRSTPVAQAARAGNEIAVMELLSSGADPGTVSVYAEPGGTSRMTPLLYAIEAGHDGVIQALIRGGADLEQSVEQFGGGGGRYEVTALTLAIERGSPQLVQMLLTSGADPNHALEYRSILDASSTMKSPMDIAMEANQSEIVAILRSAGGTPSPE